jgi:ankyrin repeat protein
MINNENDINLSIYVRKDDIDTVRFLLENGVNPNTPFDIDMFGIVGKDELPLIIAAEKNNIDMVKLLLKYGANPNLTFTITTPLIEAILKNNIDIVNLLIESGANVNTRTESLVYPLMVAIQRGKDYRIIKLLVDKGSVIEPHILTQLSELGDHTQTISLLLKNGIDINYQNNKGDTVLMIAIKNKNTKLANFLIESGANINLENKDGMNALLLAISKSEYYIVNLLLNKGANVNMQLDDRTPLIQSIIKGDFNILKLLVDSGADVNMPSKNGTYPLIYAVQRGSDYSIIKYLVDNDAKLDPQILIIFALDKFKDHTQTVKYLFKKGVDSNYQNDKGDTALMVAIKNKNSKFAKLLIDLVVDIDLQNIEGMTASMLAAYYKLNDILKILILKDADLNIENSKRQTLFDFLKDQESANIILDVLREKKLLSLYSFLESEEPVGILGEFKSKVDERNLIKNVTSYTFGDGRKRSKSKSKTKYRKRCKSKRKSKKISKSRRKYS